MTRSQTCRFSKPEKRAIRFSTLEAICAALECQPGDLLEYAEDPPTALSHISIT